MGDKATLAKARIELEELYEGIPDESVNLTFQDLADVKQNTKQPVMELISEREVKGSSPMKKLPSLDFSKGLQAAADNYHHHQNKLGGKTSPRARSDYDDDDADMISGISQMSTNSMYQMEIRGGRRRPGIAHSNICTICSTYIYVLRHRCLVCGRVYCRQCVSIGMGEMTEGRKCIECLGRRFSHRYIGRAGEVGCCGLRYSSMVKQAELKWAERGPRRSGIDRRGRGSACEYDQHSNMNNSRPHDFSSSAAATPRFAMSTASLSSYSPTHHHHIPL